MKLQILSYCSVTPEGAIKNEEVRYKNAEKDSFSDFVKSLYHKMGVTYPKFFKMDELCKLAFISSEVLLEGIDSKKWAGEKVTIVLGNKSSSLSTDQKHYESFRNRDDYFPSPAIFVYTLPNIMMGELCIRHGIKGENSCFLQSELDAIFMYNYVHDLFDNEDYEYCITGWVNYQPEKYEAHLYLINKFDDAGTNLIFNENFKQLLS